MNCFTCGSNHMIEATTIYVEKLENGILIAKNVPCKKCSQCGEEFFSMAIMKEIERLSKQAGKIISEVMIIFCIGSIRCVKGSKFFLPLRSFKEFLNFRKQTAGKGFYFMLGNICVRLLFAIYHLSFVCCCCRFTSASMSGG